MASEHETADDYEEALRKQREAERRDDAEEAASPHDSRTSVDPDADDARRTGS